MIGATLTSQHQFGKGNLLISDMHTAIQLIVHNQN